MQQSLFGLQTELVDAKVEVSVSRAIAPLIEKIENLRQEMHQEIGSLRREMHHEIGSLRGEMHEMRHEFGTRLTAVETALGMRQEKYNQIRTRFLDYSFKAGWLVIFSLLSGVFSLLAVYLHSAL